MFDSPLDAALTYHAAGICTIPILTDGSRTPKQAWKEFQKRLPSETEIKNWFSREPLGVGIVTGEVSGGLEVLDFEDKELIKEWLAIFKTDAQHKALINKLRVVESPRGFHVYYRCPVVAGNTDLALRPPTEAELAEKPERKSYKLIETRGEGGFIVAPGSAPAVHPMQIPYKWFIEGPHTIEVLTPDERELLLEAARSFNRYFPERPEIPTPVVNGDRPGDLFNQRASWAEILEEQGWTRGSTDRRWIRPGGSRDSASVMQSSDKLYVFSTSTALPASRALSKFEAYAHLHHAGDFAATAKALAAKGYCKPRLEAVKPAPIEASDDEDYDVSEWPTLAPEAYHGITGEFVRAASENSEADPAAILAAWLIRAAASFGTYSCFRIGDELHPPRLFGLVIGNSAKARKGTSLAPVRRVFTAAEDRLPAQLSVLSGLSSGEGLIAAVKQDTDESGAQVDKRRLIIESEFGGPLKVMQREGNILSAVIRDAWDSGDLSCLTRKDPLYAKGAHICILGQCTKTELLYLLQKVDKANGYMNRFLTFAVRRAKVLAYPKGLPEAAVNSIATRLAEAIQFAQVVRQVGEEPAVRPLWESVYHKIANAPPTAVSELVDREETQIKRLALVYALLDCSEIITVQHLQAALAVMDFCKASAKVIFTNSVESAAAAPDKSLTNNLLALLKAGEKTQKELVLALRNKAKSKAIAEALAALQERGVVAQRKEKTTGAPRTIWRLRHGAC